jgi:hypothetical protein
MSRFLYVFIAAMGLSISTTATAQIFSKDDLKSVAESMKQRIVNEISKASSSSKSVHKSHTQISMTVNGKPVDPAEYLNRTSKRDEEILRHSEDVVSSENSDSHHFSPKDIADYRQEATGLCKSMYYESDQSKCLDTLSKTHWMTIVAIQKCETAYYDGDKQKCFVAIRNKSYSAHETQICGNKYYDSDKIACFKKMGQLVAKHHSNRTSNAVETNRANGVQVCQSLRYQEDKTECFQSLSSVRQVDSKAASICASIRYDEERLSCLSKIVNKSYLSSEVEHCGSLRYDSDKLSCFEKLGTKME